MAYVASNYWAVGYAAGEAGAVGADVTGVGAIASAASLGASGFVAGAANTGAQLTGIGGIQAAVLFGQSTLSAGGGGVSISDVGSVASQVSLGQSAFIAGSFLQPEQGLHAYASALQYTAKFGLEEAAQLLADEENLLTSQLLKDAINGVWSGAPSLAEKAAALAALSRLKRQLSVSSNFMDGYLRAVVTLPVDLDMAGASTLEDCCLALARGGLADDADNATERIDRACDSWKTWLKDIAARRVQLVVANTAGEEPPVRGGVRSGKARSNFNWSAFGKVQ